METEKSGMRSSVCVCVGGGGISMQLQTSEGHFRQNEHQ